MTPDEPAELVHAVAGRRSDLVSEYDGQPGDMERARQERQFEKIEEVRTRLARATRGRWGVVFGPPPAAGSVVVATEDDPRLPVAEVYDERDLLFIAHAPEDVRFLLEIIDAVVVRRVGR